MQIWPKSLNSISTVVVGRVLNDGRTYTETTLLTVNDAYGVKSNIVRVTTQVSRSWQSKITTTSAFEKVNRTSKDVNIDGLKEVLAGSTSNQNSHGIWTAWGINLLRSDSKMVFLLVMDYPERETPTFNQNGLRSWSRRCSLPSSISVQQFTDSLKLRLEVQKELLKKAETSLLRCFPTLRQRRILEAM